MYKTLFLSPVIPSTNVAQTVLYFQNVLRFELQHDYGYYAILSSGNLTLHIINAGGEPPQMSVYMEVNDIEELWNMVKDKVNMATTRAPFDQPYMMREVHLTVPFTGTLLMIGQNIEVPAI